MSRIFLGAAKPPHNSLGCDGLVIAEFRKFINWPVRVKAEDTQGVAQKGPKVSCKSSEVPDPSLITRVLLNVSNLGTLA